jgi:cell division transport system ATP-binding protein
MWEEPRLLPDRSVRDKVSIPLDIIGVSSPRARVRVEQVLELVGMERHIDAMPRWLSGLEQQRVALARAIVHEPALLVADEPGGNLDPEGALAITQMLRDVRSRGTTVVITTRDRDAIEHFGDRVIVMNRGFLIEDSGGAAPSLDDDGRPLGLDVDSADALDEVAP